MHHTQSDPEKQAQPSGRSERASTVLTYLGSSLCGNRLDLMWNLEEPMKGKGFLVQRSLRLPEWENVGFISSAAANQDERSFTFTEFLPSELRLHPVIYYRLRHIDQQEREHFSPVIGVQKFSTPSKDALLQNSPNPLNPDTRIGFILHSKQRVTLMVHNVLGKVITLIHDNRTLDAGYHEAVFGSETLPFGTYKYTLITESGRFTRSMDVTRRVPRFVDFLPVVH